ncbi:CinA family protein [Amphritea sp. HPY]|uniref:CinA family protein n=1 Tax=Amphritea sp. HPY TaxID=3421652 RepID=UPI003D7C7E94
MNRALNNRQDIEQEMVQSKLEKLVVELARQAQLKRIRIATAESCTGGWVAQELTALAGSSEWFECGFITYSNEAKQSMLSVPQELFCTEGAVSKAVVIAMALGAVQNSRADLSVSISGVAGPGGGSPEKPVGTVWLAWYLEGNEVESRCYHFPGERSEVRQQAVEQAIKGLIKQLSKSTV